MRTLKVKASTIGKAAARAKVTSDDWQAVLVEILLVPQVYKRWQTLNADRFDALLITRHPGQKPTGTREDNLARCAAKSWAQYAGYTLSGIGGYRWNSVTDDWYGHAPSCCWDGVRRETRSFFIEALHNAYYAATRGVTLAGDWNDNVMREASIEFVNDLAIGG